MKKLALMFLSFIAAMVFSISGCAADNAAVIAEPGQTGVEDTLSIMLQINNPMMIINGEETEVDPGMGTTPVIQNDRTLVPVRAIIENMGGSVEWNQDTQTATLNYNNDEIRLVINSTTAYFNDEAKILDASPIVINDRTMLPIRFISESFKFGVLWNEANQTITITNTVGAADDTVSDQKVLIAYYSLSGTTEGVAYRLQGLTGGDIYKIEMAEPYSGGMYDISEQAEKERETGNYPELKGDLPDISDYDVILIGGPVWSHTLASPLISFLTKLDFSEKTVVPFWTDAGDPGDYEKEFGNYLTTAAATEGLGISGASSLSDEELDSILNEWLGKLGVLENRIDKNTNMITITIGDTVINAELNGSVAAQEFKALLPVTVSMTRFGEHEYYGSLPQSLTKTEPLQTGYEVGDLAFWTPGNLFAVYFDEPDEAPEGLMILGKIISDLSVFDELGSREDITFSLAE